MLDAIKPLLDSGLITEGVGQELTEAWEARLMEAREQVRAELREEFAQRHEHDRQVMVEALDRMVTEGLRTEIEGLAQERQQVAEDRVRGQVQLRESATRFNDFMVTKLAEEIGELRKDRRSHQEGLERLERFVIEALAQEIREFAQDKQALVETRVRLVRDAEAKLTELKSRFVAESSQRLSRAVSDHLKNEFSQLHEDIRAARENQFGRRIFEAYAAEFSNTHLNENRQVRELRDLVDQKNRQLEEATRMAEEKQNLAESKEREIRRIQESNQRQEVMAELLGPLNEEKRRVMQDLLESVQTSRLKNAYEKYLPAVLAESAPRSAKRVIQESVREVTGDKTVPAAVPAEDEATSNVIELRRLAGL